MSEIKQQLTVDQAADIATATLANGLFIKDSYEQHEYLEGHHKGFKSGAEWQMEQDKRLLVLLKGIAEWPGNLSDKVLQARTGPNDAALRGGMVCDMRDIAIEAIRTIEPDYTPFK